VLYSTSPPPSAPATPPPSAPDAATRARVLRQGDVWATATLFVFSFVLDNTSLYDPFWPLAPVALCSHWAHVAAAQQGPAPLCARQWLALGLVWAWAARLLIGVPWAGWFQGLAHEDWRYIEIRRRTKSPALYWVASLVSLHLTPTLLVFAALRPLGLAILAAPAPLRHAEAGAALVSAAAILLEGVADEQLRRFRQSQAYAEGGSCEIGATASRRCRASSALADAPRARAGVWAWCRHPNYSGELLFWCGAAGLGIASGAISLCAAEIAAPAVMIAFFRSAAPADFSAAPSLLPKPTGVWARAGWRRCR